MYVCAKESIYLYVHACVYVCVFLQMELCIIGIFWDLRMGMNGSSSANIFKIGVLLRVRLISMLAMGTPNIHAYIHEYSYV